MPEPEHTALYRHERVYIIGTPGSNLVKIGRTVDVPRRLADIQRMSPVPLEIRWTHPGGHELETRLHRHFKALRSHGEWFHFEGDPVALVQAAVDEQPWLKPRALTRRLKTFARREQVETQHTQHELRQDLTDVVAEVRDIEDPVERYLAARGLRKRLVEGDAIFMDEQRRIATELKEGRTWRRVGELLGVSGARAERIARST